MSFEPLFMYVPLKILCEAIKTTYRDESGCWAILYDGYIAGDGRQVICEDSVDALNKVLATVHPVYTPEEEPDFIAGKPNYKKYKNWDTYKVLRMLNID